MKTEELIASLAKEFPYTLPLVLYQDKHGWYDWCPASFWDDPKHAHYVSTRTELSRSTDAIEVFQLVRAYNQMLHGREYKTQPSTDKTED